MPETRDIQDVVDGIRETFKGLALQDAMNAYQLISTELEAQFMAVLDKEIATAAAAART